jgi:signal transduction histidine kinase
MGLLGGALTWLGWQLIVQDRQLERQRTQERLEHAADQVAGGLESSLRGFNLWLPLGHDALSAAPPAGLTLLVKNDGGVRVHPAGGLLYLPPDAAAGKTPDAVFAPAERLEFREHDSIAAMERLRALAASRDPDIRAGALLRLGRNLRKLGRPADALDVYAQLALLKDAAIEGTPVELIALDARCTVLDAMGRREELVREALRLDAGLRNCRWNLTGAVWDFHRAEAARWATVAALSDHERQALAVSRAVEWLSRLWPRPLEATGERVLETDQGPVLASWSADPERLAAFVVQPDRLEVVWKQAEPRPGMRAALVDANGKALLGSVDGKGQRAVRSPAVTGLAATLVVTGGESPRDRANSAARRRFLLAGFTVLGLVLIFGTYFILQSMAREHEVARLQSEFVSAVSHEFRTPLTTMRQLSEMLAGGRIANDAERHESYEVLLGATCRLHRLVESLLDFGRMEAAAYRYQFAEVDAREVVSRVAGEFGRQAEARGITWS